ncbi:MAG: hypothetical protein IKU20_00535, partial [Lachnospiraceae bacterium]|nr:hypothetical protein [Lachnospiraceae bacterium]
GFGFSPFQVLPSRFDFVSLSDLTYISTGNFICQQLFSCFFEIFYIFFATQKIPILNNIT